mmetsp:Transcript_69836/g.145626  ORF Transcript_69836/g.145626 Transcript_69836/m.145626 type:complete len:156 (-) Transcript_69836:251-718(-)|eukprot:CAMPEP_0181325750 /NCGR_PEP_ID=MMETSP1101-20121128/21108_1 /TAXON_ID=46948 /ORGANISM="Rhodomonas abbreviata, Strain Caron Lab Isolate" /LENGTH=155 /DNA_ID=CAMNT_0023434111 /DNA_START=131 /DNA_END=601 /DNA_ORIENTATION=-
MASDGEELSETTPLLPREEEKSENETFETGNWMLDALLRPGSSVSRGTLSFLNKVFYLLFSSIMFLMWLTEFGNIHTYVFMFLAMGLYFSVRFFVTELQKAKAEGTLGGDQEDEDERLRAQEQEEMRRRLEQEEEVRRREQEQMQMMDAESRKER